MGNVPEKCDSPSATAGQGLCESKIPVTSSEHAEHAHGGFDNFHCVICENVFKDPVMCNRNEHVFCRACITKYLARSQTCPSCMEPLTVETLRVLPRTVLKGLSELKVRCDFHDRGCRQIVKLEKLEEHVKKCGFAPAVCSNEGCQIEVNARDLIYHETTVCKKRGSQCHNCAELKQDIEAVKEMLSTACKKLVAIEARQGQQENELGKLQSDTKEIRQNLNVIGDCISKKDLLHRTKGKEPQ